MSYDIYLTDKTGETIQFEKPHTLNGGTYAMGGTRKAWLNVTWNYGSIFRRVLGERGIRAIYGKTGAESVPILKDAINNLTDNVTDDYWEPTEGNARRALEDLLILAYAAPEGIWMGD